MTVVLVTTFPRIISRSSHNFVVYTSKQSFSSDVSLVFSSEVSFAIALNCSVNRVEHVFVEEAARSQQSLFAYLAYFRINCNDTFINAPNPLYEQSDTDCTTMPQFISEGAEQTIENPIEEADVELVIRVERDTLPVIEEWIVEHDGNVIDSLDHGLLEVNLPEIHLQALADVEYVRSIERADETIEVLGKGN